jgi:hypothetical protein
MPRNVLFTTIWAILLTCLPAAAADVTGEWAFEIPTDMGTYYPTCVFQQDGEKLTGTISGEGGVNELEGTVKGNEIQFSYESEIGTITYEGTIEGTDSMNGVLDVEGYGSATWTAKRSK